MILGPNLLQVLDQIVVFAILKTMQSQSKTTRIQRNLASSHEKGYCWIVIRNQKLSDGTHSYSTILKMLFSLSPMLLIDTSVLYALFGDYIFARSTQCSNLPVSPQMFYKVDQFLLSSQDGQQRQIQMLLDRNLVFLFFFAFARIRTPKTGVNGRSCLTIGSEIQNLIEKFILKFRF